MELPNLSNSMAVGRLRYIQSVHESGVRRNPDTLVRHFMPMLERWRCTWLGRKELARLRAGPFYYYLVARTKYYDKIFLDALSEGMQLIVNIGCGSDTRAYRFEHLLRKDSAKVLECDQRETILAKQRLARRWRLFDQVEYMPLDLNDNSWPEFERWLTENIKGKTLVLMEGVSPYVNDSAFGRFLLLLANTLPAGSRVAFDFKLRGFDDSFGRVGRTQVPFRLSSTKEEVEAFHEDLGYLLEHMELSSELSERLLPGLITSAAPLFREDGLVRLQVRTA